MAKVIADSEQPLPSTVGDGETTLNDVSRYTEASANSLQLQALNIKPDNLISELENGKEKLGSVEEPATPQFPEGMRLLVIVVALVLTMVLVSLDETILGTAIPKITAEFNGLEKVTWYGSVYLMTSGGFLPTWGKIYTFFPLKTGFLCSILIFEVGSLMCGVAPSAEVLITGRAVAGVGGAGLGAGAMTIVGTVSKPQKRPLLTGIVGSTYGLSAMLGPLIGGAFTDKISWRWCFYINLPIGALAAFIIFTFLQALPATDKQKVVVGEKIRHMDLGGAAILMGGIIMFILAMQYGGQTKSWDNRTVIGLLVGSAAAFVFLVVWEIWQNERAMIVPRLLRTRAINVTSVYQFFLAGAYFIALFYLPLFFQSIGNASPIESGVRNLPFVFGDTFGNIAGGFFVSKTGHAVPCMALGSLLATISSGLFYTFGENTSVGRWVGYQLLGGFGWGLSWLNAISVGQANAAPADLPSVTSLVLVFQTLGGAICLSAAQSAFVNELTNSLATIAPDIDTGAVLATGATEIRTSFGPEQILGILQAYMGGLRVDFATMTAFVGLAFLLNFFNSWSRLYRNGVEEG